jgi:hypothetical protein
MSKALDALIVVMLNLNLGNVGTRFHGKSERICP